MLISARDAMRLGVDILVAAGVPADAAHIQLDLLIEAELRGHASHGLLRLPRLVERIGNEVADPTTRGAHRWVGSGLLAVDGQHGLGPVVALDALEAISGRARTTGVACAAISASNHLGMLSWYVERIALGGQIALAFTTSEALVHPWGGRQAQIGSNPIAIGVPAHPLPLVLDMATSSASMGKIHDYGNRGQELVPGWALDETGDPTTDPDAARNGSIAPFGGPKGYGLAIALEALVGSMTQAALGRDVLGTLDSVHKSTKGDVFIVMQPPTTAHGHGLTAYLDAVRASPRQRADVPVLVPGDGARQRRRRALIDGFELPDEVWAELLSLRAASKTSRLPPGQSTSRQALSSEGERNGDDISRSAR